MKIPAIIDLDQFGAVAFVNNAIKAYGQSKDINELAITVHCKDEQGNRFDIVQFHRSRNRAHFLSA